ncbi:hypothetical protein Poly24_02430 [Rosistilla carotiformis]|uniref:Uncharacterized protein n=1 Tax=Rosistilla carotiformis TaxID=2528017 RepID=A0A518JLY0_9BACT|nr:hypothetical protein Poly24_02430 [Rosistilla carotiformis]
MQDHPAHRVEQSLCNVATEPNQSSCIVVGQVVRHAFPNMREAPLETKRREPKCDNHDDSNRGSIAASGRPGIEQQKDPRANKRTGGKHRRRPKQAGHTIANHVSDHAPKKVPVTAPSKDAMK